MQTSELRSATGQPPKQKADTSKQKQHTYPHSKRVPGEYGFSDQLPEGLAEVVSRWDSLPDTVRSDILKKVREEER